METFSLRRAVEHQRPHQRQPRGTRGDLRDGRLVSDHARALAHPPHCTACEPGTGCAGACGRRSTSPRRSSCGPRCAAAGPEPRARALRKPRGRRRDPAARFGGDDWRWSLTLAGPAELLQPSCRATGWWDKFSSPVVFVRLCQRTWGPQPGDVAPALLRLGPPAAGARRRRHQDVGPLRGAPEHGRAASAKHQAAAWLKGQALLRMRRSPSLAPRRRAAEAKIVGAGRPEHEALDARSRSWAGRADTAVGQDRVRELLQLGRILCLPSLPARGRLPFVAIEALAMELPVVIARGGVPELIQDSMDVGGNKAGSTANRRSGAAHARQIHAPAPRRRETRASRGWRVDCATPSRRLQRPRQHEQVEQRHRVGLHVVADGHDQERDRGTEERSRPPLQLAHAHRADLDDSQADERREAASSTPIAPVSTHGDKVVVRREATRSGPSARCRSALP